MHVLARVKTDPTNRGTINFDAKNCGRLLNYLLLQEFVRIFDRVRMRKKIAQPEPDFRLFACLTSDSASFIRHGRMVQLSRTRCINYFVSNLMPAFWTSR